MTALPVQAGEESVPRSPPLVFVARPVPRRTVALDPRGGTPRRVPTVVAPAIYSSPREERVTPARSADETIICIHRARVYFPRAVSVYKVSVVLCSFKTTYVSLVHGGFFENSGDSLHKSSFSREYRNYSESTALYLCDYATFFVAKKVILGSDTPCKMSDV